MRLPVPSKSDFEMTARPKRRVDGSLAKTWSYIRTGPNSTGFSRATGLRQGLHFPKACAGTRAGNLV